MKIRTLKLEIKGTSPLIIHNGAGANPIDPREMPDFLQKKFDCKRYIEAIKPLSSKKKKSETDFENLALLGFYSSLYLNDKGQIIIPAECFLAQIIKQSMDLRKGPLFKKAVTVPKDSVLEFENKSKPLKSLFEKHRYDSIVRIASAKTPRTRAIFNKWSFKIEIEFISDLLSKQDLIEVIDLGKFSGFLARRPQYGRYTYKVIT